MSLPPFDRTVLLDSPPLGALHLHTVLFQDIDAAGVVFYPRILAYFHDAWVGWLRALGEPLEVALAEKRWAAPIQWCESQFLRPMRFGDALETAIVATRIEGGELAVGFRSTHVGGKVAALGQTRQVFVDLATFQRTSAPEPFVAKVNALAGSQT